MRQFLRKASRLITDVAQVTREARYMQGARTREELNSRFEEIRSGKFG